MKAIAIVFSSLIVPLIVFSQTTMPANIQVRTLDEKLVSAASLVKAGVPTVVIFWNDRNSGILDAVSEVTDLVNDKAKGEVRVVAIYQAVNGDYSHVKPMVYGSNIEADVYIDLNGELSRTLCLPEVPAILFYKGPEELAVVYRGVCMCFPEITSRDMLAMMDTDLYNDSPHNYLTR